MNVTTRTELRSEIELAREKFHRFLVTIPDTSLKLPSKYSGWTIGQLLYLMSVSPRIIKSVLKRHTQENPHHSYISKIITGPLLQKTNEMFIRSQGDHATRWTIATEYDNTYMIVLELLDAISDDDFDKTLTIPDIDPLLPTQITIENLFHYVKHHFEIFSQKIDPGSSSSEKKDDG
jgi:hypothetical protein